MRRNRRGICEPEDGPQRCRKVRQARNTSEVRRRLHVDQGSRQSPQSRRKSRCQDPGCHSAGAIQDHGETRAAGAGAGRAGWPARTNVHHLITAGKPLTSASPVSQHFQAAFQTLTPNLNAQEAINSIIRNIAIPPA